MTEYMIRHRTVYTYKNTVLDSQNLSCLLPSTFPGQEVIHWKLEMDPVPEWTHHWQDAYGNWRDAFSLSVPHDSLEIIMTAKVNRNAPLRKDSVLPWEAVVLPDGSAWKQAPALRREFSCASPLLPMRKTPGFEADDCFPPDAPVEKCLLAYMQRVYDEFHYDPEATTTFTPLEEVYKQKSGVCQDFAHAAIAELRRRGFAAGYVSGFLETEPKPGEKKLRGVDATHAWYAVYVPDSGWLHYDPTNNVVPGDRHIVTGWGRDYGDVAPVKGVVLGGGEHTVEVQVDVWRWPEQVPEEFRDYFG